METPSSLERITRTNTKSLATIGGVVVAAYTLMAGTIIWSFSEVTPISNKVMAACEHESQVKLADLSHCKSHSPGRVATF
jgi:hypothetical protein